MMAFSEAARFAVPLFFAISGYFFVRSQSPIQKLLSNTSML